MSVRTGLAPAVMFQGTGSDVGKSVIVAGLCRLLANRGYRVRPFKPQNMSNNAAVTPGGGEIGRAQALQARACRTAPTVDMNPVLLKPQTEIGAQVIVHGRVAGTAAAANYQRRKGELLDAVLDSFTRLRADADIVLVEGAGSAAEVNLRDGDIANMGFAVAADVPVVLIGDIERGGVIASMVGTMALLPPSDRRQVRGYLINKFRGDVRLFQTGTEVIRVETGLNDLGIVPFHPAASRLPAEDAASLGCGAQCEMGGAIRIAVPLLSRIANFDDFDPLRLEPDVTLDMIPPGRALPGEADLVILPGSKATIADLGFIREQGWDIDLKAHLRRGGHVLGICGGYQMLGRRLHDPDGIEGPSTSADGLGLLDVETILTGDKKLVAAHGRHLPTGAPVSGYEMHIGRTSGPDLDFPLLDLDGRSDGATASNGKVSGCYLHGLFASDRFRHAYLSALRERSHSGLAYDSTVEQALDELAEHLSRHIDCDALLRIADKTRPFSA
jgi:adenosylcobyric acid synthase